MKNDTKFNKPLLHSETGLVQINSPNGRYYEKNEHKYYSVTSILSATSDKSGLQEWIDKVGENEAERIRNRSASEGTDMHQSLTEWISGRELTTDSVFTQMRIKPLQTFLSEEIKILIGCDAMLSSNVLQTAGTLDLIYVNHDNNLILCDFKTASQEKKEEWLTDYIDQVTLYAMMFEENHTRLKVNKGLLLFSYSDLTSHHIYFNINTYKERVINRVNMFKSQRES